MSTRTIASLSLAAVLAVGASACGTRNVNLDEDEPANVRNGAELFAERCNGCHTLNATGGRGSKPTDDVGGGEPTNGPNFNVRKETEDDVLFAIRNGGFSGAIMPANIVVGQDAQDVAAFLAKYAGRGGSDVTEQQSPNQESGSGGGSGLPGN